MLIQFLSSERNIPGLLRTIGPHLENIRDTSTEILIGGTGRGGLADDFRTFETLDIVDALGNVTARSSDSFDVMAIGNSLDGGLAESRELLNVPVLGYLEANLAFASLVGDRFSLLVPTRPFISRYTSLVRMYGYESRCAGVFSMDFDRIPAMNALFDGDEDRARDVRNRLEAIAALAAEKSGADVLLPCGPPALFLATQRVHSAGGSTVLDGFAVLCKLAEAMAALAKIGLPYVARNRVNRELGSELREIAFDQLGRISKGIA